MARCSVLLVAALTIATASPAAAFTFDGQKAVLLETSDGASLPVGTLTFTPDGEGAKFSFAFDASRFKDFFLSMREFKCVEGKEIQCFVPYPYPNPKTVTPKDLRWLETSLIFMFKTPSQFGATLANGLVYELKDTGDALVGEPRLVDLNEIAAPPDDASQPPFGPRDRLEIEPGARWISRLVIR